MQRCNDTAAQHSPLQTTLDSTGFLVLLPDTVQVLARLVRLQFVAQHITGVFFGRAGGVWVVQGAWCS